MAMRLHVYYFFLSRLLRCFGRYSPYYLDCVRSFSSFLRARPPLLSRENIVKVSN